MRITIEGLSIDIDIPEEDSMYYDVKSIISIAADNAKKQVRDELTSVLKSQFLRDPQVQEYIEKQRLQMLKNLKES